MAGNAPELGVYRLAGMIDLPYETFSDFLIAVGKPILLAAAYILVGFLISRFARKWVECTMSRHSVGWSGTVLLSKLVSIAIKIATILFALTALGIPPTGLLAVFGAFTVAIGLSLQDVLKNFFAGIYLLIERPFKVGDRVAIRDVVGEVQGIDIRTTLVKNIDSELVLIPNAVVFTEVLTNDTHFGMRRLDFAITSESRTVNEVDRLVRTSLENVEGVLRPIPATRIVSSKPAGLTVSNSLVIDNRDEVEIAVVEQVIEALSGDTVEVTSK